MRSIIFLIATNCNPLLTSKSLLYNPTQSQQPFMLFAMKFDGVVLGMTVGAACGNRTIMLFVSAHFVYPVFLINFSPTYTYPCWQPWNAICNLQSCPLAQVEGIYNQDMY